MMATKVFKRILVFGGTGFIGLNFAKYMAGKEAGVLISGSAPMTPNFLPDGVEYLRADATDITKVRAVFARGAPDAVIFMISQMSPRMETDLAPQRALVEIRALLNVIECCHEVKVSRIIYCSSGGAIYGPKSGASMESDPCFPTSVYGQLKLQAEKLIETLCPPLNIGATILRIGNPYGPGQSPFGLHGVIPIFIHRMLTKQKITVIGSTQSSKEYLYIDDVSSAIWQAIIKSRDGIFNISSGVPTSLGSLIATISAACATVPDCAFRELAGDEVATFSLDISKARDSLEWAPKVNMEEGIMFTKNWIAESFVYKA